MLTPPVPCLHSEVLCFPSSLGFLSSTDVRKRVHAVVCTCASVFPSHQEAGLASLVRSVCRVLHTDEDLALGLLLWCLRLEILNIFLDKGPAFSFRTGSPKLCSWLCLKDTVFGELSPQSLSLSEHSKRIAMQSWGPAWQLRLFRWHGIAAWMPEEVLHRWSPTPSPGYGRLLSSLY